MKEGRFQIGQVGFTEVACLISCILTQTSATDFRREMIKLKFEPKPREI